MTDSLPLAAALKLAQDKGIVWVTEETLELLLGAAAPPIRDEAAAAERERWLTVLADHYLMGVNCNPDTKQDNPICGCSRVFLGWHSSIGAARQAWIDHVKAIVEETPHAPH